MKKINSLTAGQEQQMIEFREEWRQIGLGTGPADLDAIRPIIKSLYASIGKKAPHLWRCESPLIFHLIYHLLKIDSEANLGANLWDNNLWDNLWANLGANLGDNLWANLGDNLRDNLGDNLRDNLGANLWANLWDNLRDNLWANLGFSLRADLDANLWDNLWDNLRDNLDANLRAELRAKADLKYIHTSLWGSLDSYWIAWYLFPHQHLRPMHTDEQISKLNQWATLARNCFWWYPFDDICFVCDRPDEYHFDEQWRLHNPDGPAVRFSDGWSVYAVHGVMLPKDIILHPEAITVGRIDSELNVEIRRVMIERYGGQSRYLLDSGAQLTHSDGYGDLYRSEQANDEPLVMVKVVNSTPEPNGEFRDYFLRVPPNIHTAEAAVAWTFGMNPDEYQPEIQT